MFRKIQEAVTLLYQEYIQNFSVMDEARTQDLREIRSAVFWNGSVKNIIPCLSMTETNEKAGTRNIWNCSDVFWNARPSTTGIQPAFRNGIILQDGSRRNLYAYEDDHMRNAQLKTGYIVQTAVDSEYIVTVDIFQDRNDVWTLVAFLKEMDKKLGFRYPSITLDSGYKCEDYTDFLIKKNV